MFPNIVGNCFTTLKPLVYSAQNLFVCFGSMCMSISQEGGHWAKVAVWFKHCIDKDNVWKRECLISDS